MFSTNTRLLSSFMTGSRPHERRQLWLTTESRALHRDAASAELELDTLQEVHKALIRADAGAQNPDLYGPLAAAMERLTGWLRALAEGGALQETGEWELVLAGPKVREWPQAWIHLVAP